MQYYFTEDKLYNPFKNNIEDYETHNEKTSSDCLQDLAFSIL